MFFARATAAFISVLASVSLTMTAPLAAAPEHLERRDDWVPKVLEPHENIVWMSGRVHNVTWDTSAQSPPTCGSVLNTALYLAQDGAILDDGSVGSTCEFVQNKDIQIILTMPNSATDCLELLAQHRSC